MKISGKILVPLLATAAIGFCVSIVLTYQMSSAALEEASASTQKMAIANAIVELEGGISFNVLNAKSLAQTGLLQPYLSGTPEEHLENIQAAQNRIINMRGTYSYVMLGILDTTGLALRHTEPSLEGTSFAEEPFFKGAMTGEVTIGNPFRHNNMVVYTVAAPVFHTTTKEIIGVVFNVSALSDTMSERMHLGDKGGILVAANNGLVFIHKNPDKVLKQNLNDAPWGQTMFTNEHGDLYFEENDEKKHAYYDILPSTGWLAVAVVDVEEVAIPSIDIRDNAIFVAIIILIFLACIVYFYVNSIVKALLKAVKYAASVAAGDLNSDLELRSNDELGQLAASLRSISEALRNIMVEYKTIEERIERGDLAVIGDSSKFSGDFAKLVDGTNAALSRFRLVIDNLPSPVALLNADLKVAYLNTAAVALTTSEYQGQTCHALFNRDDDGTPTDGLRAAVRTGQPAGGETKAHPCGGVELDIVYNAIPLFTAEKKLVSVLQLVTDVTAFKKVQQTIMRVAEEAGMISSRVAEASEGLADQLEQSEQGSTEQAMRITETATAMGEMNSTIVTMATNARNASTVSASARTEAETGSHVVQKAVESIQVVQMQASKLKAGMARLDESAKAISEIMDTISDIADQTNLLALNAAIEAARAGEAGRGFSVVADEVRKLAEKTMTSTAGVSTAVNAIQINVTESVIQVEDSVKAIEEAAEFAEQSGIVFKTIVGMVENAADQASNIAMASEEQSAASDEINQALGTVNTIATETSKIMQDATKAVGELSNQSQALFKLIEDMKTL